MKSFHTDLKMLSNLLALCHRSSGCDRDLALLGTKSK